MTEPETEPSAGQERPVGSSVATIALVACCTLIHTAAVIAGFVRAAPGEGLDDLLTGLWSFEDLDLLRDWGALSPADVWLDGEWWRVASAGLLHGSWLHLGLNMMGMWAVGQWTERAWGPWRQLALFTVSSLGGCLASLAWAEASLVVGASAGIFGMAGALVVARAWGPPATQAALEIVSAKTLAFWLGFWLLVGFALPLVAGIGLLAQAGHIGGLVFGVGLGWVFCKAKEHRLFASLMSVGLAAGLVGLTAVSAGPSWRENYHLFLAFELLDRDEPAEAVAHFDELSSEDPVTQNAAAYAMAEARVELERAKILVTKALEVEPDNPDFLDTLGWIECGLGEVQAGRATLEQARDASDREIPEIEEHLAACIE